MREAQQAWGSRRDCSRGRCLHESQAKRDYVSRQEQTHRSRRGGVWNPARTWRQVPAQRQDATGKARFFHSLTKSRYLCEWLLLAWTPELWSCQAARYKRRILDQEDLYEHGAGPAELAQAQGGRLAGDYCMAVSFEKSGASAQQTMQDIVSRMRRCPWCVTSAAKSARMGLCPYRFACLCGVCPALESWLVVRAALWA